MESNTPEYEFLSKSVFYNFKNHEYDKLEELAEQHENDISVFRFNFNRLIEQWKDVAGKIDDNKVWGSLLVDQFNATLRWQRKLDSWEREKRDLYRVINELSTQVARLNLRHGLYPMPSLETLPAKSPLQKQSAIQIAPSPLYRGWSSSPQPIHNPQPVLETYAGVTMMKCEGSGLYVPLSVKV